MPPCTTHPMRSSCILGQFAVATCATASASSCVALHRRVYTTCADMKGCLKPYSIPVALLKAGQHCQLTPPDVEDPQLRPVTLDKLLDTRYAQLAAAAGMRRECHGLHLVKHCLLRGVRPQCSTHEISSSCNLGQRAAARCATASASSLMPLHGWAC
jgi:hypothetical protein